MNNNTLSLRLLGDLPSLDEINRALGTTPTSFRPRGTPITRRSKRMQPEDVWLLEFAEWEGQSADSAILARASATLRQLAPALAAVDRTHIRVELVVGITQFDDFGGCDLPYELIASAASATVDFEVSVLAVADLEDDDDE
jgi:hypothetical protein